MKSTVFSCSQYTALARFISFCNGGGMAKKDVLLGGGSGQMGQTRTRGGGGQKVRIWVGRPFWMAPYLVNGFENW